MILKKVGHLTKEIKLPFNSTIVKELIRQLENEYNWANREEKDFIESMYCLDYELVYKTNGENKYEMRLDERFATTFLTTCTLTIDVVKGRLGELEIETLNYRRYKFSDYYDDLTNDIKNFINDLIDKGLLLIKEEKIDNSRLNPQILTIDQTGNVKVKQN